MNSQSAPLPVETLLLKALRHLEARIPLPNALARRLLFLLLLMRYYEEKSTCSSFSGTLARRFALYREYFHSSLFEFDASYLKQAGTSNLEKIFQSLKTAPPLTPALLGSVYEHYLTPHNHNREGIFYTPQHVVCTILNQALPHRLELSAGQTLRILDPACGSGIFLVEAFRTLKAKAKKPLDYESRKRILEQCIFGIDRDPLAVQITRFLLQCELAFSEQLGLFSAPHPPHLSENIRCGNSLLDLCDFDLSLPQDQALAASLSVFSWKESFPQVFPEGGFDVVIGNPPYGLARGDQISPPENEKLKEVYRSIRSGKINKYLAFMAKGYEVLRPGGILSFIVPNAWLGIQGGEPLRRLFLNERALESLIIYNTPVFATPSVEAVVFKAVKGGSLPRLKVFHLTNGSTTELQQPTFVITHAACLKNPGVIIPLNWPKRAEAIFAKLDACTLRLGSRGSGFKPMIALQAYSAGKGVPPQTPEDVKRHIYDRAFKEDADTHPYLQGEDVRRYHLVWSGGYLKYGPWLAEPQSFKRFCGPRILVREITAEPPYLLHACYTDAVYLYNKSVLHILPEDGRDEAHLLALLAILNSKLVSFVLQCRGRKTQRKLFRKIVNDDLRDLPLPDSFERHTPRLAELCRYMMAAVLDHKSLKNQPSHLQSQIDSAVFTAYGLNSRLITSVEEALGSTLI